MAAIEKVLEINEPHAFRLGARESLGDGIRRIAVDQLTAAIEGLRPPVDDPVESLHSARKATKKVRTLLRLIRDEIGDDVYRTENAQLRNIARTLADARDADAASSAFETLAMAGGIDDDTADAAREILLERRQRIASAFDSSETIATACHLLEQARGRATRWPIERDRFDAIKGGIKRIYRRGRGMYADVIAEPSDLNFHEWRKCVKHYWYVVRVLRVLDPKGMRELARDLNTLGCLLGDDHDLALLREALRDGLDEQRMQVVEVAIADRRQALQEDAKSRGARIYSDRGKETVKRFKRLWDGFAASKRSALVAVDRKQ